jgi:hypothetical protein
LKDPISTKYQVNSLFYFHFYIFKLILYFIVCKKDQSVNEDTNFLNENGKRLFEDHDFNFIDTPMDTANITMGDATNINNPNEKPSKTKKRKFNKKLKKSEMKLEKKLKPPPFYNESVHPAQILNQYHQNLLFNFEAQVNKNQPNKVKYTCYVEIKIKKPTEPEESCVTFSGDGLSKKDAKKKCCLIVLSKLYSETYKPPSNLLEPLQDEPLKIIEKPANQPTKQDYELESLNKRIKKICNKSTVLFKSPAQLLYELNKNISDTGECVIENGKLPGQKYTYQFKNVRDSLGEVYGIVYGFGKRKLSVFLLIAYSPLHYY